MPTKSANALGEPELTSWAWGEFAPSTFATSPRPSNAVLAVPTLPTLQPARVNGTHGAGALLPAASSMLNVPSGVVSVQHWKDELDVVVPGCRRRDWPPRRD
jgi:hypothetical protein